jgi:serine phosphatase RsbU (regulator of sigma subunit)
MIDPVKFKKILVTILKFLIVVELISALSEGLGQGQWQRFTVDLVLAIVLYITWDRVRALVLRKKQEYKRRIETSPENIKLREALVFSLLWSDEIYADIPPDRKRLVVISYTLIALGVAAAFFHIGGGLMQLVLTGALVLSAVNLLSWVVSLERSEKEAIEMELRLAREVQSTLLPVNPPQVPGYDIAGRTIPAREVGGDYFDFIQIDEHRLSIAVADVSGKGLPASLLMANLQATLRGQALLNPPPDRCIDRTNKLLFQITSAERFVTLFYAVLDTQNHILQFCNAGHTPPLLFRDHVPPQRLDTGGLILGVKEDAVYKNGSIEIAEGSVLVICSDGVTEAINKQGEFFGEERLIDVIHQCRSDSAEEILQMIVSHVASYTSRSQHNDDVTLVVVKR